MRGFLLSIVAILGLALGGLGFFRCEGSAPGVEAPPDIAIGREPRDIVIGLTDEGSGLRDVTVSLVSPAGEQPLVTQQFPGGWLLGDGPRAESLALPLDAKTLGLGDGEATLRVVARDWSWRSLFGGGKTSAELPITIDTKPPRVSVENTLSYLQRGGSGLAVYRVDGGATRDGVTVGEIFFAGHPYPGDNSGRRLAFFALPQDVQPDPPIRVVAEDAAGNRTAVGWGTHFKERKFLDVRIELPPRFLEQKVEELANARSIDPTDRVAAFQQINSQGRAEDEAKIREITRDSVPEKLWNGPFEQLRNSKVTSHFAEKRTYFVGEEQVSNATHYGFDLATTMTSPITASNSGKVVWADDLGIYGGCVILDHGFDLFTLYGHLSRIDVEKGQMVEKGQVIGLSGATGLAGGDHLHFATLLGGVYVDPVEWWDPKWIREKVDALLVTQQPAAVAGSEAMPNVAAPPSATGSTAASRR